MGQSRKTCTQEFSRSRWRLAGGTSPESRTETKGINSAELSRSSLPLADSETASGTLSLCLERAEIHLNQTGSGSRSELRQDWDPKDEANILLQWAESPSRAEPGLVFLTIIPSTPHAEAQYTLEDGWMNG